MIVALCAFLAVSAALTLGQVPEGPTLVSPCPDVFTYMALGPDFDRWYGVINVTTDQLPSWPAIFIELDAGEGPDWKLLTILDTPDNTTSEKSNMQDNRVFTDMVYFSVQYDPQKITLRLTAISLVCTELCNVNKSDSAVMGTSANSTTVGPVSTGCESDIIYDRIGSFVHATLKILRSPRSTNSKSVDAPRQCGKLCSSSLPSKNGITPILKNQWPWQAALYDYKDGVSDIFIHPDYNASTHSSDVAILELDAPLKYSDWVRPACLWPDHDMDLKNVVGKKGLLLSWRFDSENQVIDELSEEETTMVSQETCKKSHDFFTRFTSEYTYCAGNRQESSSCPSIGSGMVFRKDSTWYLRGLLSLSVPHQNRCDPTHYAVFTDLAKFLRWIDSIVFDY